jgi:hypothetical protein
MKRGKRQDKPEDIHLRHLQNIQIILLGMIGVPQQNIRKIVGGDLNRVTSIVRHIVRAKRAKSK